MITERKILFPANFAGFLEVGELARYFDILSLAEVILVPAASLGFAGQLKDFARSCLPVSGGGQRAEAGKRGEGHFHGYEIHAGQRILFQHYVHTVHHVRIGYDRESAAAGNQSGGGFTDTALQHPGRAAADPGKGKA